MPRLGREIGRHVEYLILNDPHPDGPVVGFFRELPIAAAVVDHFGRRYIYAGGCLAPAQWPVRHRFIGQGPIKGYDIYTAYISYIRHIYPPLSAIIDFI